MKFESYLSTLRPENSFYLAVAHALAPMKPLHSSHFSFLILIKEKGNCKGNVGRSVKEGRKR